MSITESTSDRKVNPDLVTERKKCGFNVEELVNLIDGGAERTADRRSREEFFLSDPDLQPPKVPIEYLSHKEKYEESVRLGCALYKRVQELSEKNGGGIDNYRQALGSAIGSTVLPEGNPFGLHYIMFIPTIMGQGTVDQATEWLDKAWSLRMIGTYAQTELGHGTFIRGLETTATYDPKTQEFVMNSPTLTSYKWWPGGLGHASNHAIVMAQLYTQGRCHGIHPFVVQLRDEETNRPMPGVKIGEIGVKLGMNGVNNGYLGFDNVRIPRMHMLMKHNKVLEDGTYEKAPSSKLTYGTMIFVRVVLVEDATFYLRKALTISIRYSAVRHQSQIKENAPEPQIIDFVTQQFKLLPLLGSFFAYYLSAKWLWDLYNSVSAELEKGHLEHLAELHALACCLKAVSTADCSQAVEICRMACGGHGYMMSSKLPTIYGLSTAMCTYEGENTVLLLQTARYLIKSYQGYLKGEVLSPTLEYIHAYKDRTIAPFTRTTDWIISVFKKIAANKVASVYQKIQKRINKGLAYEHAWNESSIELVALAEAHCRMIVTEIYSNYIKRVQCSPELRRVLTDVLELYLTYIALKCSGDILRYTNVVGRDLEEIQSWMEELLARVRPNAVGIVDGFDIRDEILGSTLGAYDGRVYERLFEEASKSPLNNEPVNKSFPEHLKPFFKSNL